MVLANLLQSGFVFVDINTLHVLKQHRRVAGNSTTLQPFSDRNPTTETVSHQEEEKI